MVNLLSNSSFCSNDLMMSSYHQTVRKAGDQSNVAWSSAFIMFHKVVRKIYNLTAKIETIFIQLFVKIWKNLAPLGPL